MIERRSMAGQRGMTEQRLFTPVRKAIAGGLLAASLLAACTLGPYPDFLEDLDALSAIEGESVAWVTSDAEGSYFLVLGGDGSYALSRVNRNTSTETEVGTYETVGARFDFHATRRYVLPKESGKIGSRGGARTEEVEGTTSFYSTLSERGLELAGLGKFRMLDDILAELELSEQQGIDCLARIVQSHIRISQNRIQQFGGAGTAMYLDNKSTFKGILGGEFTILVEGLLNPVTTIHYYDFSDFPGFLFNEPYYTHVNTSGDGHMEAGSSIRISLPREALELAGKLDSQTSYDLDSGSAGAGGGGGAGGGPGEQERVDYFNLQLTYGPYEAIQLKSGDVVGGLYEFEVKAPTQISTELDWTLLEDLDLRSCGVEVQE